ncbi:MAG: ABC transporter permease [Bdellovibrionaceae bacterium]|nr:ABC transporter permease [Pseudobdellovibrionaceae bacterium]
MTAFLTLIEREIRRFLKVAVQTVVTPLISSGLYLLVFGVSLGSQVTKYGELSYLAFLVPGLMCMGLINNAFQNSSSSIVTAKFAGDMEDLKAAPITEQQILWALGFGAVFRGALVCLITWLVGSVFHWLQQGEFLHIVHPLLFLFFLVSGGLIFGLIGISVAFWARSFDQLSAFSAFILLPLTYLGGVFISIELLPPFWQKVTLLNPLFYLINGLRYSVLGVADVSAERAAVVCVFGIAIFNGLALWSLRKGSFHRW